MELGKYWIFQALGAIVSEVEASPKSQEGRRCHKALPRYVRMKTELIYCRQCVSALYLGKTEVPNAKGETFSDCDLHEKKQNQLKGAVCWVQGTIPKICQGTLLTKT